MLITGRVRLWYCQHIPEIVDPKGNVISRSLFEYKLDQFENDDGITEMDDVDFVCQALHGQGVIRVFTGAFGHLAYLKGMELERYHPGLAARLTIAFDSTDGAFVDQLKIRAVPSDFCPIRISCLPADRSVEVPLKGYVRPRAALLNLADHSDQ